MVGKYYGGGGYAIVGFVVGAYNNPFEAPKEKKRQRE